MWKCSRRLSIRRAESTKQWLAKQPNLSGFQFVAEGKGKSDPVAPNTLPNGSDNPDGRQKNRRVEIHIPKF